MCWYSRISDCSNALILLVYARKASAGVRWGFTAPCAMGRFC